MKQNIEAGMKLIAINECIMDAGTNQGEPALIIGKEYRINDVKENLISIASEIDCSHFFPIADLHRFFQLVSNTIEIKDEIIGKVVEKIVSRSNVGVEKYGTTLQENDTDDFFVHLQEELMDAVNYIQKLLSQEEAIRERREKEFHIPTFDYLQKKVEQWFEEKGLIHPTNYATQTMKVQEELGELSSAILKNKREEEKDAFGDLLITIIGLAKIRNIDLITCLLNAYVVIKDRTGKTENGTFIREN